MYITRANEDVIVGLFKHVIKCAVGLAVASAALASTILLSVHWFAPALFVVGIASFVMSIYISWGEFHIYLRTDDYKGDSTDV